MTATPISRNIAAVAISTSGSVVSTSTACAVTLVPPLAAYPQTIRSAWATMRLITYRPPAACQRASRSAPSPFSSGGSRAIRATSTTTP